MAPGSVVDAVAGLSAASPAGELASAAARQETPTPTATPTPTPVPDGAEGVFQQVLAWADTTPGRAVLALAVLAVGWYGAKLLVRYLGRPTSRRFRRPSVARTVLRGVRMTILVVAALTALWVLGIRLGNIVLSVTVFSAVLGIVLAPIVGSVINGLFVLADQPYEVGDMIELRGGDGSSGPTQGFVEDITLRYTKVFTLDNTFLVVPNSSMRDRDVVNFSAEDERTRQSLGVLVTYESDVEAARRLIERAARDVEEVITGGPDIRVGSARYPAGPTCYVDEYADHGVLLTLRYWAKRPYKLLTVRSKVNERIWAALEDADVVIAYPHQHLVFDETSGRLQVGFEGESPGPSGGGRGPSSGGRGPSGGDRRPSDSTGRSSESPRDGGDGSDGNAGERGPEGNERDEDADRPE